MNQNLADLQKAARALLRQTGGGRAIPFVTIHQCAAATIEMPRTDSLYLYLVLDGTLRLYTPSGMLDYVAGQYSISRIDTPLSGKVLAFSEQRDFLAVSVAFTPSDVIETVLGMDSGLIDHILSGGLEEEKLALSDQAVLSAVGRLFSAESQGVPSMFLWKNILREILYYVLCGSCGKQFLQSAADLRQGDEIYQTNSWIQKNFRDSFAVEELAERQNMSVSLFHQKFRSAVGMGPRQCQKRLRLTEARRLMLDEKKNVTQAAGEGGALMAIQANDPRITLVAGGYPLFVKGKIAGGIGVGGGTEAQDCEIAEYVVSVFETLTA